MASLRLKKLAKKLSEGGTTTRELAMRSVGYSESYSKTGHIKDTKGWEEIIEKELPDSLLVKRHKELLNKREVVVSKFFNHATGEYEKETKLIDQPDTTAVSKGLDMGYKLKGRYKPVEVNVKEVSIRIDV